MHAHTHTHTHTHTRARSRTLHLCIVAVGNSTLTARFSRRYSTRQRHQKKTHARTGVTHALALAQDSWVIIHGKVYDVTKFLEEHPGANNARTGGRAQCTLCQRAPAKFAHTLIARSRVARARFQAARKCLPISPARMPLSSMTTLVTRTRRPSSWRNTLSAIWSVLLWLLEQFPHNSTRQTTTITL